MANSRRFPWFTGCFILIIAIIAVFIYHDISQAESYQKSQTNKLTKIGLEHIYVGWIKILANSARGYKWAEKNFPIYYHDMLEFSRPYMDLYFDVSLVAKYNLIKIYTNVKSYTTHVFNIFQEMIDFYAPELTSTLGYYVILILKHTSEFVGRIYALVQFRLHTIFIDDWSPESLQSKLLQAVEDAHIYLLNCYRWFYKYVDDYSKL